LRIVVTYLKKIATGKNFNSYVLIIKYKLSSNVNY